MILLVIIIEHHHFFVATQKADSLDISIHIICVLNYPIATIIN